MLGWGVQATFEEGTVHLHLFAQAGKHREDHSKPVIMVTG